MFRHCVKFSEEIKIRKCSQFQLWVLYLLYLLYFPCVVYSKCFGLDNHVYIIPEGFIQIPYGDPLELFCILEDKAGTSKDVQFTLDGKTLNTTIVNSTTIKLRIEKPERQFSTYYCQYGNQGCPSKVAIESPPQKISNFTCISYDLNSLNCNWTAPSSHIKLNYTISFELDHSPLLSINGTKSNDQNWQASWHTDKVPSYRQYLENYTFHIKGCNIFGCYEETKYLDHFSVVKPAPPKNLTILHRGPHDVMLEWNVSYNIRDFLTCGVDFKIEYQIDKIDSNFSTLILDKLAKQHTKNASYKHKLTDLPYAHQQYEVRVYVKSKKASNDYWSNYIYKVFTTTDEIPQRPPNVTAGAFDSSAYHDTRVINVYWIQLQKYEESGTNFTYKIVVYQNNETLDLVSTSSYIEINKASLGPIHVYIWSRNVKGSSMNHSYLYIPPETVVQSLVIKSFTQVASNNGTYELSWEGLHNIDNYSIFWCVDQSRLCTKNMDFRVLEPNKTNYVINLPSGSRYQFAISANNGTATSGMKWADCDIAKEGMSLYNFPVVLERDKVGKTSVKLRWSVNCVLRGNIITGYLLTYCPVKPHDTKEVECEEPAAQQSINISDPNQKNVVINDLLPYTTYQFKISLNTSDGLRKVENTTCDVTTLEDTPTNPRNIEISNVTAESLIISWDPPLHKNGIVEEIVVYKFNEKENKLTCPDSQMTTGKRRTVTVYELIPFTNYSFTVKTCNKGLAVCSPDSPNNWIALRTAIGQPGKVDLPNISTNPDLLTWSPPHLPGGIVDSYDVRIVRGGYEELRNINVTSYYEPQLDITHCGDSDESVTYQVRAINFDEDLNHGVKSLNMNVSLPENKSFKKYYGVWSDKASINCKYSDRGLTIVYVVMSVFVLCGIGYGTYKLYKKWRKTEDIKPKLPIGLVIPEKEMSKYAFISTNDDKPQSDEIMLLPNTRSSVTSSVKQKDTDNCGSSNHTDSTALSEISRQLGPVDIQESTSDDGSNSSVRLHDRLKSDDNIEMIQGDDDSLRSSIESSPENSPYLDDHRSAFTKNPNSGYVQAVGIKPITQKESINLPFLSSSSSHVKNPSTSPNSSSYVMAGLPSTNYSSNGLMPTFNSHPSSSPGYVQHGSRTKPNIDFQAIMTPRATKLFGPESLPPVPVLPQSIKQEVDSSYIQLQSLDAIPSLKPVSHNTVPSKTTSSNGYVSPGDAVITKHLNNRMTPGQHAEETAVLDPTMSPDAYCRFSWSNHPTNDNLHKLLNDSHNINPNN